MIEGQCLCGQLKWRFAGEPKEATACNCSACSRYGALWAYGFEADAVTLSGASSSFVRSDAELVGEPCIAFHFCPTCGNLAWYKDLSLEPDGSRRVAVNLRLANAPEQVAALPMRHFEGKATFKTLPADGRCVKDMWF